MNKECRTFPLTEVKAEPARITGTAEIFDRWLTGPDGSKEIFRKSAFKKTLKEANVKALFDNQQTGSTKSGTLRLNECASGLNVELPLSMDLTGAMRQGNIDQIKLTYRVIRERKENVNGFASREILEVQLYDMTPISSNRIDTLRQRLEVAERLIL